MISVKLEVYVTVDNVEDAKEVAHDLKEILDDNGITNNVVVTDEISS